MRQAVQDLGVTANPTLAGRTWLLDWEVPADEDNATRVKLTHEAALIVAPVGVVLQPGMVIMLIQAEDRTKPEDRDMMVHQVARQPLLISERQRLRWGPGMAVKQRVLYVFAPDLEAPSHKRGRKPKAAEG